MGDRRARSREGRPSGSRHHQRRRERKEPPTKTNVWDSSAPPKTHTHTAMSSAHWEPPPAKQPAGAGTGGSEEWPSLAEKPLEISSKDRLNHTTQSRKPKREKLGKKSPGV